MELPYSNFEHCLLFNVLKDSKELKKAIAYLLTFNEYVDLKAKALNHSILIFNDEISIFIILYVGFEENEFVENLMLNSNFVSFERNTSSMIEFKDVDVKFIDKLSIVFTSISLSKNDALSDLRTFVNL